MVIRLIRVISIFFVLYFLSAWVLHIMVEYTPNALPLFFVGLIVLLVVIAGYLINHYRRRQ
ncbi:hypothetical protein AB986_04020 [Alkalihalobacillus macyae]|uniref:Uncharacterized protein n=1 Tax=Guptibacillus hwajinpoensis TaxID=208199 RepID=A0A0J6CZE3_9BACL|nr:hypothetical protein AB986_04020 [Alkalihalobacillus macyae]